jgi:hypothetical protein
MITGERLRLSNLMLLVRWPAVIVEGKKLA